LAGWILPSLAYVVLLGALGVTLKLALRSLTWRELIVYTAIAYVIVAVVLIALGTPLRAHGGLHGWMGILSAFLPPLALISLYVALDRGEASRVIPLTTAYPFITVFLAALVLSEGLTAQALVGSALIVAGAIVISV
jgi:bacterial/archaeal transporter family protein